MAEVTFGWGWPAASRKAHLFKGARSLCNAWLYAGELVPFVPEDVPVADDCKVCWKKAQKEVSRA